MVGRHSIIVAQVGIAGSVRIGSGVVIGGQAGIIGHIEIDDGTMIGAQSGIGEEFAWRHLVGVTSGSAQGSKGANCPGATAREIVRARQGA